MTKKPNQQVKKPTNATANMAGATSAKKAASVSTVGKTSASRRRKIERAARDFAVRFEGVMRELANG